MKKVTIMIPTYNQEKYVGKAIESALSQMYSNLEVIIGNDCSSDGTHDVVKKYLSDSRIIYFKNEFNIGRVKNYRKILYEYASGDYVLNLDGDDWLLNEGFIERAVKLFDKNENISCVLGDRKNFNQSLNSYRVFTNKNKPFVKEIMNGNEIFINWYKMNFVFSHFACLYKLDLAKSLNFYNLDIISSDFESIGKLFINHNVGYLNIFVGVWRAHEKNDSYGSNVNKALSNLSKYDSLHYFAKSKNIFKQSVLKEWLFQMKIGNLSQDLIYVLQTLSLKKIFSFLLGIFKYDIKIAFFSITIALKKILKHLVKKMSL